MDRIRLIKHSWLESGGVYGYRKIYHDLQESGDRCGRHRVARLMRLEGLRPDIDVALESTVANLRWPLQTY